MSKGGDWIREKRKAAGLRQGDVAKRSGVSVSYISTLERNQPHTETGAEILPDREKLLAIAKALNADPGELLRLYHYEAPPKQPRTARELLAALNDLGIHIELFDGVHNLDDSPETLERLKVSLEAVLRGILTYGRRED